MARRKRPGTERTIIPGEKIKVTPETWTKILQKGKKIVNKERGISEKK